METQNLRKIKEKRGITLIALVITVIVLLILAGVSIAALIGDDGLLSSASDAKQRTQRANVIESAQTDIFSEQQKTQDGNISTQKLREILDKYFVGVPTTDEELEESLKNPDYSLKTREEYGGENIEVKVSDIYKGNLVTEKENLVKKKSEEVNAKIGEGVDYEISDTANEQLKKAIGGWRIFYASEEEMFLISSNTIDSSIAFGGSGGIPLRKKGVGEDYTGAKDVFETNYGATYNEKWKTKLGNSIINNKNPNAQATAYLCDSANWIEYVGKNAPTGTYAVGGPTKELLVRSWVASGQTKDTETLDKILEDTTIYNNGYEYNKPDVLFGSSDSRPIQKTILPDIKNQNKGLYNNESYYWLASPCSGGTSYLCRVHKNGYVDYDFYTGAVGVRPLVSIPMSKVQMEEDGTIIIENN